MPHKRPRGKVMNTKQLTFEEQREIRAAVRVEKKKKRFEQISQINPETLKWFKDWSFAQFTGAHVSGGYMPSQRTIDLFVINTMLDLHNQYDMALDISWAELFKNWEIDEIFTDFFAD